MTAYLVEDRFSAATALSAMTELFAAVIPTLQGSTTLTSANVFRLESIVHNSGRIQRPLLALVGIPLSSFLLPSTAALAAFVATAIQRHMADTSALRWIIGSLVTYCRGTCPPTPAFDVNPPETGHALANVTFLLTFMSTD